MHQSVWRYVEAAVCAWGLSRRRVVEVGSLDVNGGVRDLFTGDYTGCDMRPGPGVDTVVRPGHLPFPSRSVDVVLCLETLEHDPAPWLTVGEAARILRLDGLLIVTARGWDHRGVFPTHDHPADYWRFSPAGMRQLVEDAMLTVVHIVPDPDCPGVLMTAVRD